MTVGKGGVARKTIIISNLNKFLQKERMHKRLITSFLIFFICLNKLSAQNESLTENPGYGIEDLPSIVIAYRLSCGLSFNYPEFKKILENPDNCLGKLSKEFEEKSIFIPNSYIFGPSYVFIVQNNIKDHFSGFVRIKNKTLEESKVPFRHILFVTTPIESYGNRILVIDSIVGPEITGIFSVDKNLNVKWLYNNSFLPNEDEKGDIPLPIGSIYSVQVIKPGVFLLQERLIPGGRMGADEIVYDFLHKNRTFRVDVTDGVFKISKEKDPFGFSFPTISEKK